jgi:ribonucleoside-diphosphate reductase alpha chain
MFVIKRKGQHEEINFDKVHQRIKYLVREPYELKSIQVSQLSQKVIQSLYDGVKTSEIDNYTANLAASISIKNREYAVLAGRITINNCHKNTLTGFADKINLLYMRKDKSGKIYPLISDEFYKFVEKNHQFITKTIDYNRDYLIDFFGFKTLEKGYLLKVDGKTIERPQDLFMRTSIHIHLNPSDYKSERVKADIAETYNMISNKYFVHATPTLFNAGTCRPALASCFLLGTQDSLQGIMKTAQDCANISKWAGGIGFHCSDWRSEGALIRSTNGLSGGTIPFLRLFNDVARAFNQGGKRLGSFAVYMEPHHPDIMAFLSLRRNHGDENLRTRDLFLGLWISDIFMERVKADLEWSTFDSDLCPGLTNTYGDDYKKLYLKYETEGKVSRAYRARDIWLAIFNSQKESGMPYMLYKDTINKHSNQNNIGVIKSSNLCSEITIYSDDKSYGTCHLASICLPQLVYDSHTSDELKLPIEERRVLDDEFPKYPKFNYKELARIAGILTKNLNNVIDKNWYPNEESKQSSNTGRPIGIGVQGLADVFYKFQIPFDSDNARKINKQIFETIYYGALSKSTELAKLEYQKIKNTLVTDDDKKALPKTAGSYPMYLKNGGSKLANGEFHWQSYGLTENDLSGMFDWQTLRDHINIYGVRNSLLLACMPTASTAHIMGSAVEGTEAITSNMYKRKVLSGEFIIINKYLMNTLTRLDLWDSDMEDYLKMNKGSVQGINGLPDYIKQIYRNVWEIQQKSIIEMAKDRQVFIDQSQSMNLFIEDFTFAKFNSAHFYGWSSGLKTGSYYIRTRPATTAQTFTVDPTKEQELKTFTIETNISLKSFDLPEEEEICLLCSS